MATQPQVPSAFASRIIGTGSHFPQKILTNGELAKTVDTTDEWIQERTGIHSRHISNSSNPAEWNSGLATEAARKALEMAGKKPEDIDAIFLATCTPDTLIPSTACWVQKNLGAKKAWALDLNAACSGFIFGLSFADQMIRTGFIRNALVIGSDVLSAFTNWNDRGSCILFGDGAGAVVVEQTSPHSPHRIYTSHLKSDGALWELFHIPAGGSRVEVTPEVFERKDHKMQMKGREIFKEAVRTMTEYAELALSANRLTTADISWVIAHQANARIIESVAKRLDLPLEKMLMNIERRGNNSAATIPTVLDENVRNQKIQPGQFILLDAFGAGLTTGSLLLRW